MYWLAVTFAAKAASIEVLSDALQEAGAMSVDVTDAYAGTPQEHALFGEPGEPGVPNWELSTVRALFPETDDIAAKVTSALREAGLDAGLNHKIERVEDQDWVRQTQSQFQPVRVSPRLWVVPTWHDAPDPAAINLIIDPGLAFGTGTHPTTRLCLEWLDAHVRGSETILDYGCGSGILAIAAVKLGAGRATGVDIDAAAMLAARHNAMQNHVTVEFESANRDVAADNDIVVANILANPLLLLAPLLARKTRSGGTIVLSGILEHQAAEVSKLYTEWYVMNAPEHADGWVLLSGTRRQQG
jgi:ribosomal protein L11 methyltransferase